MNQQTSQHQPAKSKQQTFMLLSLIFSLLIFTTGCVQDQVGINFAGQHQGTFVQNITLGEKLTSFSPTETQQWLDSLDNRARQLQGKAKIISDQQVEITIPFANGKDLVSKFNHFFNPNLEDESLTQQAIAQDLIPLQATMSWFGNNALLLERNKLTVDVNLQGLGVLNSPEQLRVISSDGFDLEISLNTPWGAKSVQAEGNLVPKVRQDGHQLIWILQPGETNHLEAIFWLPSYLGLGTVAIAILIIGGFYYKYKRFPWTVA